MSKSDVGEDTTTAVDTDAVVGIGEGAIMAALLRLMMHVAVGDNVSEEGAVGRGLVGELLAHPQSAHHECAWPARPHLQQSLETVQQSKQTHGRVCRQHSSHRKEAML